MSRSTINVFAGVNGSGKSSILGESIRSKGGSFYNPDSYTRELMEASPALSLAEAQSAAWKFGYDRLVESIDDGCEFSFETTLGGKTIPRTLLHAAQSGTKISVFYIGLESVELNIQRVAARVDRGGHDIPVEKIKARWEGSILNIIRLLPHLNKLRVYDNSVVVSDGSHPAPALLVSITEGRIDGEKANLLRNDFPEWAKPIVVAAIDAYPMG